ncbi:ATP-binding protein [Myxococcota bacterium]|nr:ATP-binding protein [Myxococcota bacterium]
MIVELAPLVAATLVFLAATFGVAEAAERRIIPERFSEHPLVFALALGVYATSWTFFGSVGFARDNGLGFLAIYLGPTLACLAIPVLWRPMLHLARERQLASLADVLAFRYRSRAAGFLVTLVMLAGSLPYLALQVRAFVASVTHLSQGPSRALLGLGFCVVMSVFAILFGARHATTSARHPGLLVAMALESVIKLVALSAVAAFALFGVHGGWDGLGAWLVEHPEALRALYAPVADGPWASLLILSFAAAFLLPRQFHVAFTECPSDRALLRASWAFPLLLLAMNAGIPVILWAGERIDPTGNPDLWVLQVVAREPWLATLAFLGGLSAVSGMIVVTSLALSSMAMNYLVLPVWRPRDDFYARIVWARRALIAGSILASWIVFVILDKVGQLVELGLVSFVSVAQLLPGVIGVFFWRRASREGFVAGLLGGVATWSVVLVWPMLARAGVIGAPLDVGALLGLESLDPWTLSTTTSLAANGVLFALGSVLLPQRAEEAEAAAACVSDASSPGRAEARSIDEVAERLAQTIGPRAAEVEIAKALAELSLDRSERRPVMLRSFVEHVEKNLSGLFGPLLASLALGRDEGLDPGARRALAEQMHFIEARLESDEEKLRGLARDVDEVRRFLHRVLEDMPVGVCALGAEGEIVVWNGALSKMTGQVTRPLIGTRLADLPEPWAGVLGEVAARVSGALVERSVEAAGRTRILRLGRTQLETPAGGLVLLVEDLTEQRALEKSVAHQDRLASVGRLAAGVAHEIGNPLTGILMLSERLEKGEDTTEEVIESASLILHEGKRIHGIVNSLVTFSRGETWDKGARRDELARMSKVLTDAVNLVRLSRRSRRVQMDVRCAEDVIVRGDPQRLAQVFVNLLANACDASPPGSKVQIVVTRSAGRVLVDVVDEGTGIPAELRERIFEPFFTTKEPGQGTGLGLSLVHSIVREHGGSVEVVASEPGRGTTFRVAVPDLGAGMDAAGGAVRDSAMR